MGSETDRSARDWLAVVVSPARAPTTRNPCSHTYSLRRPNFSRQPRFLCTRVQNTKQLPPYTASISVNHTMAGEIETEGPDYTRLHITPLTPALLSTFLPPSVLPIARNISYHSIETFPERAYGFVELPSMEASKLQKKLNGSILKGTKIRIEAARPQKLPVPDDDPEPEKPKKERTKKSKKRKRDDETIPAAEIGERSVKRGWTTPSSKSDKKGDKKNKKAKSKYTDGKECLFKTVVPPNKTELKDGKKKRKNTREEIVHEFAKTTKHASFLRGSKIDGKSKTASEFVEGKGWVDEDGNLVEEVTRRQKPATEKDTVSAQKPSEDDSSDESSAEVEMVNAGEHEINDAASHSAKDDTSEASSCEGESDAENIGKDTQEAPMSSTESSSEEESESTDSSDSESESTDAEEASPQDAKEATKSVDDGPKHLGSRPTSSSGLTITIPPPSILTTPASASKSVHPLEALYKRPASTPSSKGTLGAPKPDVPAFSFFGDDKDGDQNGTEFHDQVPFTPFTQKEFEFRGQRSAAPTPDTAHPNKRFMWPVDDESDHEQDDDDGEGTPSAKDKGKGIAGTSKEGDGKGKEAESDFQKWFYEHRGDTNRAWKKRRKVVAKESRQRENRKRADRAA